MSCLWTARCSLRGLKTRPSLVRTAAVTTAPCPTITTSIDHDVEIHKCTGGVPIVYHPAYSPNVLPKWHTFPMPVFTRIHDRLLQRRIIEHHQTVYPSVAATRDQILLVHEESYVDAVLGGHLDEKAARRIGFGAAMKTPGMLYRTMMEVSGTLLTAKLAMKYGMACNTSGGTHHAYPTYGSGYCIFNDLAVTAQSLIASKSAERVLILDLDVHQGDGTAFIFRNRPDVFTLSMHCASNFPARKQVSHLDIALPDHTGDNEYLRQLSDTLPHILSTFRPDIVLYDAGVDVHVNDRLGRLSLTDDGIMRRDKLVLDTCLGSGVPVAGYVGGGYDDDLNVLADRHIILHQCASELWADHML